MASLTSQANLCKEKRRKTREQENIVAYRDKYMIVIAIQKASY